MAEGQSTVEEYRSRAAILRRLARETRDQAARERLLLLAARFERLADQVEKCKRTAATDRQIETLCRGVLPRATFHQVH